MTHGRAPAPAALPRVAPGLVAFGLMACVVGSPAAAAPSAEGPTRPATDVGGVIAPGTTWTAAGSPYHSTSSLTIPAGVTLTIEPGVEVRMGNAHSFQVQGALDAVGTDALPIVFTSDAPGARWGGIRFAQDGGSSHLAHVNLSRNGSSRTAMLDVRTSDVVVSDCRVEDTGNGVGMDIVDASPTVERCVFRDASAASALPPGALRIRGTSDPVVADNFFQSNINAPVYLDANASPTLRGNRFELNGWDGVFWSGSVERAVSLPALGPRRWRYWVDATGITVKPGGTLTVEPGVTLAFVTNGIRVQGTLRMLGSASAKVLLTSDRGTSDGSWRDIVFEASSTPYDAATGDGSIIDHTLIEYGGAVTTGAINVLNASPRVSNSIIRHSGNRGITVTGADAAPSLVGNLFDSLTNDPNGVGVYATGDAKPELSFNLFVSNRIGIELDDGAVAAIGPYNRFDYNEEWGVLNHEPANCSPAENNDWSDVDGPDDRSEREDGCGLSTNVSLGDIVSDGVDYVPWVGQVARPFLTAPRCGTSRSATPTLMGYAPPGSHVLVYDNFEVLTELTAPAGTDPLVEFSLPTPALSAGSHVLALRAELDGASSGISDFLDITVDPRLVVDPSGMYVSYDLDGIHYAQPLNDLTGCASLQAGEWEMRIHPDTKDPTVGAASTMHIPVSCPSGAPEAALLYLGGRLPMAISGGVATADFAPGAGGEMRLETTCAGVTAEVPLGTVSLEFNGFVYNASSFLGNPFVDRVGGATVTLFTRESEAGAWVRWDAANSAGQQNPQVTGRFGWYGFYPPPGQYRVEVEQPDFDRYVGPPVTITSQAFMETVGLHHARPVFLPALANRGP